MKALHSITFLSDFGTSGGYVAACEATMARLCPQARVFHITHEVAVGDIPAAALVLARVAPLYPVSVHMAVVDPGVGTTRSPLAAVTGRGDLLVGPDNGLLADAAEALGGAVAVWALDMTAVRTRAGLLPEGASSTFHGRDLFAPASALLASGADPRSLGRPLDPAGLVRLASGPVERTEDGVSAPVIEIDRFGNVGLGVEFEAIRLERIALGAEFLVGVAGEGTPEWTARMVQTYADLSPGELGLIRDSWGQAALALNAASAAELLGVRQGVMVTLTPAHTPGRS